MIPLRLFCVDVINNRSNTNRKKLIISAYKKMNFLEFTNLLLISDPREVLQFKIVQLLVHPFDKESHRIYFGNADEMIHAELLEKALSNENIAGMGTEKLPNNREVCERKGAAYQCVGMGRCIVKIAASHKSTVWFFNFFGHSEYNLTIDIKNIRDRVSQFKSTYEELIIEEQHGGGFYNWLPTEKRVKVKIRKEKNG
ncbi:MAG: hypothetical protein PVI90_01745 [Desulfobacteraceae bacterium]